MMQSDQIDKARRWAANFLQENKIALRDDEVRNMEIADFNLHDFANMGLHIVVYVNTDRCCAKELVMLPWQICPEHRHPDHGDWRGKEETFRCRAGQVFLYVPGEPAEQPKAKVPDKYRPYMTVWHEIVLNPGDQYTLAPDTLHWFQAGPDGAIVSEFSTQSRDELDVFTDPNIKRVAE